MYVAGARGKSRFLECILTKSESKLVAQVMVEIQMLFPEIADGF